MEEAGHFARAEIAEAADARLHEAGLPGGGGLVLPLLGRLVWFLGFVGLGFVGVS